tara:strand:+ start:40 stop:885 length:846 start_codon:yes stop_codon:yes gene_type:complete
MATTQDILDKAYMDKSGYKPKPKPKPRAKTKPKAKPVLPSKISASETTLEKGWAKKVAAENEKKAKAAKAKAAKAKAAKTKAAKTKPSNAKSLSNKLRKGAKFLGKSTLVGLGVGAAIEAGFSLADYISNKDYSNGPAAQKAKDITAFKKMKNKKRKYMLEARKGNKNMSNKEGGSGPSKGRVSAVTTMKSPKVVASKSDSKPTSIAAAKKAGSLYYYKDGKKMAAVLKSDLKGGESLGEYMNRMTNKTARKSSPSKKKKKKNVQVASANTGTGTGLGSLY